MSAVKLVYSYKSDNHQGHIPFSRLVMVDITPEPFSTSSRVIVNCGNIVSWNKIRKKAILTSTEELTSSIENTLATTQSYTSSENDTCTFRNTGLYQTIKEDERANLTITLKIFLSEWDETQVTSAIDTSLSELGLSTVDTVILSFPPCTDHEFNLDKIKPVWQALEDAAYKNKMKYVGTADLTKDRLKCLFEWSSVKPRINQMNLAHCCIIPQDLATYAKEVNIRLFTHNDERCILPVNDLQQTLKSSLNVMDLSWHYRWVTRYHSVINRRGIVTHKGYMVELEKDVQ